MIANFVPGISTMAPPMAGLTKMPFGRFTLADTTGAALWLTAYLGVGYIFREQLEDVGQWAERFGSTVVVLVIVALASWLGFKYYQRWSFLRSLRVNRITPEEVMEKIKNNEAFLILDMRAGVDDDDSKIPGATYLTYEDLEQDKHDIPLDRDIILYCT